MNPDGDALGSALGLHFYLKEIGLEATVISPNEYPEFLYWMPANDIVIRHSKKAKAVEAAINNADFLVCVDFNDPERAGKLGLLINAYSGKKLMIDHHLQPKNFADIIISDTSVSSTAEMVARLVKALGDQKLISADMATCLMTGIITDTGVFSYNSSLPETYEIVSLLLEKGARKDQIVSSVYDTFSYDRMRLMGYLLNEKMVYLPEYNTTYASLTLNELEKFNYTTGDHEGFVNLLLSIKGVKLALMYLERNDHVKVSLRSKGDFSVNDMARKHFNGGGHKNAAGGEEKCSVDKAIEHLLSVLPDYTDLLK